MSVSDFTVVSHPPLDTTAVSPQTSTHLIQLMTDALVSPPLTSADAITLYKTLTQHLIHYLVNNLPTLESKVETLAKLIIKEVETVTCYRC